MMPHFQPLIFNQFGVSSFTTVVILNLIAASTNAFNAAVLARQPDHYKRFTLMGVIWLAYAGGIGGGVLRDILVSKEPSSLINPWYIVACFVAAGLALLVIHYRNQSSRHKLLTFMTSFSLPWYAMIGVQAALQAHLGYFAAILIGTIATTGGRSIVDLVCGVTPLPFVRGGHLYMLSAVLTAVLFLVCFEALGWTLLTSAIVTFAVGFGFRLAAQAMNWEEWLPWDVAEPRSALSV